MIWKKLLNENKIQGKSVSGAEVKAVFAKAQKTLRSAEHLLGEDEESAYQLAHEANSQLNHLERFENIIVGNYKNPTCNYSHHMVYLYQIKEVIDYDRKQYCKKLTI